MACGFATPSFADNDEELPYINAALQAWLEAIEADTPYLLVDRGSATMQLMHGKAVLRSMPLVADSLGIRPSQHSRIQARLRRYRPSSPWSDPAFSPFDWEQNLVEEASTESALYFSSGFLVYASSVWSRIGARTLQLKVGDLRALYNTCALGTPMVVLPSTWREGRDR